mgnify:CR=1 FL=1
MWTHIFYLNAQYNENLPDSENIWAFIEGSELPEEILVISAHYDHIGIDNGVVYNGADDDGTGVITVMSLAKAFSIAMAAPPLLIPCACAAL